MSYWRINTDRNARDDVRTCDFWFKHGMAFTGDYSGHKGEHAVYLAKLALGDGVFMHESAKGKDRGGIVGYGYVKEEWDGETYEGTDRWLYVKELYEYRIAVDWEVDCRRDPLPIGGRLPHMGTSCGVAPGVWYVQSVQRDLHERGQRIGRNSSAKVIYRDYGEAPDDNPAELQTFAARVRRGQPMFREKLLALYGEKCAVTGCGPAVVLEGAHIWPHAESGMNQSDNGLLLRADIHILFDADLLRISPDTLRITIDPSLKGTEYWALDGRSLRQRRDGGRPSYEYLRRRWNHCVDEGETE